MKNREILYISSESNFGFKTYFDGYAFFGVDLVIGNIGFQKLLREKGCCDSYEDGNYLLIEEVEENNYRLTRDHHGYYPIFYYSSDEYWCISNSIVYIVEQLKKKGISVSYNEANVEIWKCHWAFSLQLTSHNTFVNEIKVLPTGYDISILKYESNSSMALIKRESNVDTINNYNDALKECLDIWKGRYLTIISNNNLALWNDLTGGLDSRCLFSFMVNSVHSTNMVKRSIQEGRLKINSNSQHLEDFKISKRLVSLFDLSLNDKINDAYKPNSVSAEKSYSAWKYFNIGRYSPIVFSLTDFNPKIIEIGGEGGEDNRNFYTEKGDVKYSTLSEYIEKRYKKIFSTNERYEEWLNQINDSCSKLANDNSVLDISILHYREFRSTCHTMKHSKRRLKLAPLGSKFFDKVCQLSEESDLKSGQVIYDSIYNNCNKLLYIPFDKLGKEMTDTNVLKLKSLESKNLTKPGKVYWSPEKSIPDFFFDIPIESTNNISRSPLNILYNKALKSLNTNQDLISFYFGEHYIKLFHEKFESINFNNLDRNLHAKGSFLHALILIDFLKDFSE